MHRNKAKKNGTMNYFKPYKTFGIGKQKVVVNSVMTGYIYIFIYIEKRLVSSDINKKAIGGF